jgi:hypothetical protein
LQQLRQKIVDRDYYLSAHAEEEMWDDDLERADVENAILEGRMEKKLTKDPRGARYRIEGPALDGRFLHVICRLDSEKTLRIITIYALD